MPAIVATAKHSKCKGMLSMTAVFVSASKCEHMTKKDFRADLLVLVHSLLF